MFVWSINIFVFVKHEDSISEILNIPDFQTLFLRNGIIIKSSSIGVVTNKHNTTWYIVTPVQHIYIHHTYPQYIYTPGANKPSKYILTSEPKT